MFDRKYEKCRFLHKDTKLLLKELKNMFNLLLSIFAACRWLVKNLLSDSSLQKIITDAPAAMDLHIICCMKTSELQQSWSGFKAPRKGPGSAGGR